MTVTPLFATEVTGSTVLTVTDSTLPASSAPGVAAGITTVVFGVVETGGMLMPIIIFDGATVTWLTVPPLSS
jgi:hypothetical protein